MADMSCFTVNKLIDVVSGGGGGGGGGGGKSGITFSPKRKKQPAVSKVEIVQETILTPPPPPPSAPSPSPSYFVNGVGSVVCSSRSPCPGPGPPSPARNFSPASPRKMAALALPPTTHQAMQQVRKLICEPMFANALFPLAHVQHVLRTHHV